MLSSRVGEAEGIPFGIGVGVGARVGEGEEVTLGAGIGEVLGERVVVTVGEGEGSGKFMFGVGDMGAWVGTEMNLVVGVLISQADTYSAKKPIKTDLKKICRDRNDCICMPIIVIVPDGVAK